MLVLDNMEYATDTAAQAAYVTSDAGSVDSQTKLLLHCNGTDGSATFTDDGDTGHTVTRQGTAQIDTAYKKFGTGSGLFDGNSDYLTIPDHADFAFGGGDWTVDFWVRFNSVAANQMLFAQCIPVIGTMGHCKLASSTVLNFYTWEAGLYAITVSATGVTYSTATWYHVAVVHSGTNYKIFIDGIDRTGGGVTDSDNWGDYTGDFCIGTDQYYNHYLNGWLDEFRISKGIARWTSNFTPLTKEYPLPNLQCYSEDTIKEQGSYSLKSIAKITDSLNDTLTRTVSPTIDLSDSTSVKIKARGSRTGSNFKIGIHDSGGTTSEHTINIASADTWQTETWDVSGISNANKDVIDSIIITILNADALNTFYLDEIYSLPHTITIANSLNSVSAVVKGVGKPIANTLSLSSAVVKASGKVLVNSLTLTSALAKAVGKVIADTCSLASAVTLMLGRTISNSLAMASAVVKKPGKVLANSITLTVAIVKGVKKVITNTLAIIADILHSWLAKGKHAVGWSSASSDTDPSWSGVDKAAPTWTKVDDAHDQGEG